MCLCVCVFVHLCVCSYICVCVCTFVCVCVVYLVGSLRLERQLVHTVPAVSRTFWVGVCIMIMFSYLCVSVRVCACVCAVPFARMDS